VKRNPKIQRPDQPERTAEEKRQAQRGKIVVKPPEVQPTIDLLWLAGLYGAKLSPADLISLLAAKGIEASRASIVRVIGYQIKARGYRLLQYQPRHWLPIRYRIGSVPPTHWLEDQTRHKRRRISWHEQTDVEIGPKYYPAISGVFLQEMIQLHRTRRAKYECFRKDPRVFTNHPDAFFHHSRVLVSAPIADRLKLGFTLKELFYNHDHSIFIDSGGFQIQTGQVRREEWTSARALAYSVKNGHIFPILDSPILPHDDFNKNLAESYESARYYSDHRPNASEIVLNVAHGRNLKELKRWIDEISKITLDGWALGSSYNGNNDKSKDLLQAIFLMLRSGILDKAKLFHVFRVGKPETILYLTILNELIRRYRPDLKFEISFDCSTPLVMAKNGKFYRFTSYDRRKVIQLAKEHLPNLANKEFQLCDCPVCRYTEINFNKLMNSKRQELQLWIGLHNIYADICFQRDIASTVHLSVSASLERYTFSSQITHNIGIIQQAVRNLRLSEQIIEHMVDTEKSEQEEA
jgi:queuine/archaeosine tRNA-ribosyltransferase